MTVPPPLGRNCKSLSSHSVCVCVCVCVSGHTCLLLCVLNRHAEGQHILSEISHSSGTSQRRNKLCMYERVDDGHIQVPKDGKAV